MKNDHSFKLVAAVTLTGVFFALFSPARAADVTTDPDGTTSTRTKTFTQTVTPSTPQQP
jgi:hypothetical protein